MSQEKTIAEVTTEDCVCLTHGIWEDVISIKQSKDLGYRDVKTRSGTYEVRKDYKVAYR